MRSTVLLAIAFLLLAANCSWADQSASGQSQDGLRRISDVVKLLQGFAPERSGFTFGSCRLRQQASPKTDVYLFIPKLQKEYYLVMLAGETATTDRVLTNGATLEFNNGKFVVEDYYSGGLGTIDTMERTAKTIIKHEVRFGFSYLKALSVAPTFDCPHQ